MAVLMNKILRNPKYKFIINKTHKRPIFNAFRIKYYKECERLLKEELERDPILYGRIRMRRYPRPTLPIHDPFWLK